MEKTSIISDPMSDPTSIRAIIDGWPTRRDFTEALNALPGPEVSLASVHKWAQSGAIPSRFLNRVVEAHKRAARALSAEQLIMLHDPAATTPTQFEADPVTPPMPKGAGTASMPPLPVSTDPAE